MLYFDHSATTPPLPEVIDAVAESMKRYYGNPSSLHRIGNEAQSMLTQARESIAAQLNVHARNILFTSGGTESNNLAIKGSISLAHDLRRTHLMTSSIEHPSVLESFKALEKQGCRVTYLPVDETGMVRLEDVQHAFTDETALISIMHVNNEIGRIQPIQQIGAWLKRFNHVKFHVDAVQSVGKLPVQINEWGVDLLSFSAHKIGGPKGIGGLFRRDHLALTPQLSGGGQELGLRSGTENIPGIVGMARALRLSCERLEANMAHLYQLREQLLHIVAEIPELHVSGSTAITDMAPHIVHVTFPGMKSEVMIHALEEEGCYVSAKSACSSKEEQPSYVLQAMGHDTLQATSGIRISLSASHTADHIDTLGKALSRMVERLRFMVGSI